MQVLDPYAIRLDGTHLIEASAGTGKTYTIETLVVRLLAERRLPIKSICVVTFTEAATAELRERIRARIKKALDILHSETKTDDSLLSTYAALPPGERNICCNLLQQALSCFDEAAIYTIHGFCHRLLCDFAYESGLQFETELITDQEQLVQETVDDFWRRHAAETSPLLSSHLMSKNINPDSLSSLGRRVLGNPLMGVVPDTAPADVAEAEERYSRIFRVAAQQWAADRDVVQTLLGSSDSLNRNKYRPSSIEAWCEALDAFFRLEEPLGLPPKELEKFTSDAIALGCRKNCSAPQHAFFNAAQAFWATAETLRGRYEQYSVYLTSELCRCIRRDIVKRKHEQNVQYFDDLLLRVHEALQGSGGAAFARRVRSRFRSALVDEFQDTDRLQYEIFSSLFGHGHAALFFIGDPKQAIYSFRSADVFTYLGASADIASRYTLTTNRRSIPELIRAYEVLFEGHRSPFVLDAIRFEPVEPLVKEEDRLLINGSTAAPLQLCMLECGKEAGKKTACSVPWANQTICANVAEEIRSLLDGSATLAERPLKAGDIAVLVRTHHQADMVRAAIRQQGIACVVQNSGNLFETHEANEMALVLAGIAASQQPHLVRSALATELLGFSAAQLYVMNEDGGPGTAELERFGRLNRTWRENGFSAMMRMLLFEYRVLPRLVALPEGERRVTNVLHLAEVLQEHGTQTGALMWELQRWFERQLSERETKDEYLLRLESDRKAVNIMTMHKSKGLEFNVVFCPFNWGDSSLIGPGKEPLGFTFHDQDNRRVFDLGSDLLDAHRQRAETEELAENLRLLYVALTRARQRCYLYWGGLPSSGGSALAHLLHNRDAAGNPGLEEVQRKFLDLGDADILDVAKQLSAQAPDCIQVRNVQPTQIAPPQASGQADEQPQELGCREFTGRMHMPWRITSFSGLVSGRVHEAEIQTRDSDDHVTDSAPAAALPGIMSLPPGAHCGTMLHAVLEKCSFPRTRDRDLDVLIGDTLSAHHFDAAWRDIVAELVCRAATQRLPGLDGPFCLADLDEHSRVAEVGFHLPLKRIAPHSLRALFAGHAIKEIPDSFADSLGRLSFAPVHGFLKGFIDSVVQHKERFYLIDWKSNLLGPNPDDYHRERLDTVMARDYYVLQYHLYALALHACLERRVKQYRYDDHFGGVFYVFLRGLHPDGNPDYGIFYDRPVHGFIQNMAGTLIEMEAEHAH